MTSRLYTTDADKPNEVYPSGSPPPYAYVPVDPFKPSLAFSLNNILPSRSRRGGRRNEQTPGQTAGPGAASAPSYARPGGARPRHPMHRQHARPSRRPEHGSMPPQPTVYSYAQRPHVQGMRNEYVPGPYYLSHALPASGDVDDDYVYPLPSSHGRARRTREHPSTRRGESPIADPLRAAYWRAEGGDHPEYGDGGSQRRRSPPTRSEGRNESELRPGPTVIMMPSRSRSRSRSRSPFRVVMPPSHLDHSQPIVIQPPPQQEQAEVIPDSWSNWQPQQPIIIQQPDRAEEDRYPATNDARPSRPRSRRRSRGRQEVRRVDFAVVASSRSRSRHSRSRSPPTTIVHPAYPNHHQHQPTVIPPPQTIVIQPPTQPLPSLPPAWRATNSTAAHDPRAEASSLQQQPIFIQQPSQPIIIQQPAQSPVPIVYPLPSQPIGTQPTSYQPQQVPDLREWDDDPFAHNALPVNPLVTQPTIIPQPPSQLQSPPIIVPLGPPDELGDEENDEWDEVAPGPAASAASSPIVVSFGRSYTPASHRPSRSPPHSRRSRRRSRSPRRHVRSRSPSHRRRTISPTDWPRQARRPPPMRTSGCLSPSPSPHSRSRSPRRNHNRSRSPRWSRSRRPRHSPSSSPGYFTVSPFTPESIPAPAGHVEHFLSSHHYGDSMLEKMEWQSQSIHTSDLVPPTQDITPSTQAYILAFLLDTVPRQIYLYMLLCLPYMYFSRVTRIFEEAEMSMPMIRQGILDSARTKAEVGYDAGVSMGMGDWTSNGEYGRAVNPHHPWAFDLEPPPETVAYTNLQNTWHTFIDSLLKEWKTLNIISVLLLSAILTILQIDGAASDPLTRYSALLSMICALMSLLYGCIYIIRFGTMRKTYKGAEWAEEAQKSRTGIWWNIWVLLAMPATWLAWAMIFYITTVMSFVWRTSPFPSSAPSSSQPVPSETSAQILVPRIVISLVLTLGLIYFALIVATLRRYGELMDRAWQRRIWGWMRDGVVDAEEPDAGDPIVGSSSQSYSEKAIPRQQEKGLSDKDRAGSPTFSWPKNPDHERTQYRGEKIQERGLGSGHRGFGDGMFDSSAFNPPVVPPPGPSIPAPVPLPSLSAFVNLGSNNSGESTTSSLQLRTAAPAPLQSHFISFTASHGPPQQLETEPQLSSRAAEASSDITGLPSAALRDSVWSQEEDKREVNHRHHLSPPQVIHNAEARNSPKRSTRKRRMVGQSTRTSGDDNSDMRISSDRESSEWDSLDSGENPDTKGRIKMVKLLNLSVANESEDELLELNLTEYGLCQDTSGGEEGRLRWEMFKQKIQAALSHTPSVPISVLEYSQPAIGSILDKFNTYLRMRGIKGEVALCEEFGMPSPNLAVYYFANSGDWPDPYEETEALDEKERGNTSPKKKKKIEQYESIPNGLQRLDVILFSREARTPGKLSGAEDDGGRGSMQAVADLKMRKISLFSNHLGIPDDIQMEVETAFELTQNGEKDST